MTASPRWACSSESSELTQNVKITTKIQPMNNNISKVNLTSVKKLDISVRENEYFPESYLSSQL